MTTSPNDTVETGIGASVTDAGNNVWSIDRNGQITVNGTVDQTTANVDELAYYYGSVWQKNAENQWYSKASPSGTWVHWPNVTTPVAIPNMSANNATASAGGAANIVDSNGNVWGFAHIGSANGYQVTVDGAIDPTTANVVQLAYVNGTIWQENTAGLWYAKTTPASVWTAGTSIDPLTGSADPVSLTWVGGGNNLASNPADWSPAVAPQSGYKLTMGSGTMNLSGNALAGDTLAISFGATANIAASGHASLKLSAVGARNINITVAPNSTLDLTATIGISNVNVSGGTLSFIGTSVFSAFNTVLSTNISGTGTVYLQGGNATGEFMEINGSVGRGLTFNISAPGPDDAGLQIDHPSAFHGNIVLQSGFVAFMGVHATSGDLLNGILEMFDGNKLVAASRFAGAPNVPGETLRMEQNSAGVMVSTGLGDHDQPGGIGTVLPLHTA
jgi:hypothetical protein